MTTEVTYRVYRGNRPYNRKDFGSYEAARNFIRKLVRSGKVSYASTPDAPTDYYITPAELRNNNIPLAAVGFSVKRRTA